MLPARGIIGLGANWEALVLGELTAPLKAPWIPVRSTLWWNVPLEAKFSFIHHSTNSTDLRILDI